MRLDPSGVHRPPWRALALLTALVAAAHLGLLGLVPLAGGPQPSPLAHTFTTRTIVVAPPVAAPEPAPSPTPARPAAAKPPAPAAAPKPAPPAPSVAQAAPVRPTPTPAPPPLPTPVIEAADPAAAPAAPAPFEPPDAHSAPLETGPTEPSPAPDAASDASSDATGLSGAPFPSAGADTGGAGQAEGTTPAPFPGPVRLDFAVSGQQGAAPWQGVFGSLVWAQDGQRYEARLSLKLLFKTIRSQHSTGTLGPAGIEPLQFTEKRGREAVSYFQREQGMVDFGARAPAVPLLPGAQDRLSVVMQIGALLAGDPARYPPGGALAIQTVGPRDAEIWIFKVDEDEELDLPAGHFVTRKLTRNPRKPFDDRIELWVAPELGYLPVRIRQTQADGDIADLQLRGIEGERP